ncbi:MULTISPECIES: hypothetical protein [unclassified Geomicrobium]|uniref:hypothetical protein n=1 Tax=unclassified Geomicrobium TaxID=2628951 RepID=UPI00045ED3E2|nr:MULTISPECIES: hypothetical protein [unclassified Geomicrobium]GAK01176.1 hypothetical protein JCM19055_4326 [Geomicrobium sp. JCM 19055]GAK09257.1 hypothetical protein JCM19038_3084 [Geomicrobium sp. JCM 19038]
MKRVKLLVYIGFSYFLLIFIALHSTPTEAMFVDLEQVNGTVTVENWSESDEKSNLDS